MQFPWQAEQSQIGRHAIPRLVGRNGDEGRGGDRRGSGGKAAKVRINFRFLWLQRNRFLVLFAAKKNKLKLMGKRSRIYLTIEK
jgi:hypothetical protein